MECCSDKTATNQSVGVLAGIFLTLALLIAVIGHYALKNRHIFDSTNQKRMVMLLTEKNRRVCSGQGDFRLEITRMRRFCCMCLFAMRIKRLSCENMPIFNLF